MDVWTVNVSLLLTLHVLLSNIVAANHCTNMKHGGSNSFISAIIISDKDAVPFLPRYKNYVANFTNSMFCGCKYESKIGFLSRNIFQIG